MISQKTRNSFRSYWYAVSFAGIVSLLLLSTVTSAQHYSHITNYFLREQVLERYPWHTKNYSIAPDYSLADIYVLSGTVFSDDWVDHSTGEMIGRGIHWTSAFTVNGGVVSCGSYPSPSGYYMNEVFDDPDWDDERSVTILNYNKPNMNLGESIIVGQVRKTETGEAGIRLLKLDNCSGAVQFDKRITHLQGLLPLDAVHNMYDDMIYICGYTGNKNAFLLKYDIYSHTGIIIRYGSSPGPGVGLLHDYDMGLHLKVLEKGSNQGNVMMLGSCNTNYGSASLVMIVDGSMNLISRAALADNPVVDFPEYAYDVKEDDNGNFYIYSNKYLPGPQIPNTLGFHPQSKYPVITYLNSSLNIVNGGFNQRIHIRSSGNPVEGNWAWGCTLLSNGVLAGLQAGWDNSRGCNLNGLMQPSMTNITPFLSRINTTYNGSSLIGTIDFWKTYHTQSSTPLFSSMGGELSNVSWPTKFAIQNPNATYNTPVPTTDMLVIAPRQNDLVPAGSPANKLAYRSIRTDLNGDLDISSLLNYDCNKFINCIPVVNQKNVIDLEQQTEFGELWDDVNVADGNSFRWTPQPLVTENWCDYTGNYKPSRVTWIEGRNGIGISIYPNPATDKIKILLSGDVPPENQLKAELIDMMGRIIGTLYEGNASNLKSGRNLKLPSVPAGLYIVRIKSEGQVLYQEKLSIQ